MPTLQSPQDVLVAGLKAIHARIQPAEVVGQRVGRGQNEWIGPRVEP
jgi:hypothetical protein